MRPHPELPRRDAKPWPSVRSGRRSNGPAASAGKCRTCAALGRPFTSSSRRTVLRRPRGDARAAAGAGAAERRQPAPDQFLSVGTAGSDDPAADGERRKRVLRCRDRFNGLLAQAKRERGSGRTLLLPESNRLQRAVPIQRERRVQRAVRTLQANQLPPRIRAMSRPRSPAGSSRARRSKRCRSSRDFVYADPPYDVEFTHYSKDGFGWDQQVRTAEWLAAHRGPVVLSNQATPRITSLYARSVAADIPRRAAPHQLHRRSHAGGRSARFRNL